MTRTIVLFTAAILVSSCDQTPAPKPTPSPAPETSQVAAPVPAAPQAAEKSATEKLLAAVPGSEKVTDIAPSVKDAAAAAVDLPKELANVADPSVTTEQVKSLVGGLNADTLKGVAEKLVKALQSQDGVAKGLKDQLSGLSLTDLVKGAELKKSLESVTSTITGLKDKLKVVTDKLQASGVDTAKFLPFLSK
jgi:hypothetical protein